MKLLSICLRLGHMVGESSIFENGLHTSSAQVLEDVQLLIIPASLLKEQIRLNPSLALNMLSSMSRHHRRHYGAIALNAMQSAPQRIGCFLLRLCPPGKKKNITFHLPYDKTVIAYTLGMKSATFSRALNVLRIKTGIRVQGTRVEIDSADRLIKFVYGPLSAKYKPEELQAAALAGTRCSTNPNPDWPDARYSLADCQRPASDNYI